MALARRVSLVDRANEVVPILYVARLIGMDVPEEVAYGRNIKVRCPFGRVYHSDGGVEASMRIYVEDNAAHCFSRCGRFSPTWLLAQAWSIPSRVAAKELLERTGHHKPTPAQAWRDVISYRAQPDRDELAAALKIYCLRIDPQWSIHQYDDTVAAALSKCLSLLDLVHDDTDTETWLDGCKRHMRWILHPHTSS